METRRILQIVLGLVVASVVLLGGIIVWELTRQPAVVYEEVAQESEPVDTEDRNRWEGRGDEAIALVKQTAVDGLDGPARKQLERDAGDDDSPTIEAVTGDADFVRKSLNLKPELDSSWRAEWWAETKYGDSYYRVMRTFEDGAVAVGPTWVVDLKSGEVEPMNVTAKMATSPKEARDSDYYDADERVVSALTRHTFQQGLTLAGALLIYFDRRAGESADTVRGWTIQHQRGPRFKAFFQWSEGEETNYAQFEFDYQERALRAVNLQATNVMQVGESFRDVEPVDIRPASYDPSGRETASRWKGRAREMYGDPENRPPLQALDAVLRVDARIDSIEWLMTAQAKTAEQFAACKDDKRCRWIPRPTDDHVEVTYEYDLGEEAGSIVWHVTSDDEVEPASRVSRLAHRVTTHR
jgi:hypothetical protein